MIKGSEVRKADHQIEPLLIDRWSPRRNFARGTDATFRSGALGAVFIQYSAMACTLCAPRHGTLADFLRSARRREQGVGKERSRSCRLYFTKELRSSRRAVSHAFVRLRSSVGEFRIAR